MGCEKSPVFYKAYNKIKHDRDSNQPQANYENVMYGLAGLFMLNLWLRKSDIENHPSHRPIAGERVFQYSALFSPEKFLKPRDGPTNPTLELIDV